MIFPFRKPAPPAASPKISPAQRSFLCRQQRKRRLVLICRGFLFLLLIGMWETASRLSWIDRFIFSSPSLILNCLWSMVLDGSLFLHTGVTLGETLLSFALVISIGLGAALILWLSPTLAQILEPYLVILNSLPKSALAPLLIVWLGNNTKTIITAAVSVALFGSIMTLHTGFSQTDPDKIRRAGQGSPSGLHSSDHQQHESKHRPLPGRSDYRRISLQPSRPGISDHLLKPGIPDDCAGEFHHRAVHHVCGTLSGNRLAGEKISRLISAAASRFIYNEAPGPARTGPWV